MEQTYNAKMSALGFNHFICDIFGDWENVKDEILIPERKEGTGNGTIHVFLGAADKELRQEFGGYYDSVSKGEDTSYGAVNVTHYFLASNVISMLGYMCHYDIKKNVDFSKSVKNILHYLDNKDAKNGLISTYSLFKLSVGSSKLRPYFKHFEKDGVFTILIRQILLPNTSYKISLYKNDKGDYATFWLIGFDWLSDFEADSSAGHLRQRYVNDGKSLQQIYYGAPGTGKSHTIKEETKGKDVIRTTFHPDSDYSTFVGSYKPTMEETSVYGAQGVEVAKEKRITYTFVKQAFLKAYLGAWQKYANRGETTEPQYLVIEEINRGNCAQIFGDLFQLLDRNDDGFSSYPIDADTDLQKTIKDAFAKDGDYALAKDLNVDDAIESYTSNYGASLSDDIKEGRVLLLPNNLYIWATMNTSDQSLFPIDSAFKRRWDWKYVKIANGGKGWKIKCGQEQCDWWKFVESINERIAQETNSDDKKLGYYFCIPPKGTKVISEDKFVGKVIFYLWNDVFKDGDISLFKVDDKGEICFDSFYNEDNTVKVEAVRKFLAGIVGEDEIKSIDIQTEPLSE